jgi:hypothetical protein
MNISLVSILAILGRINPAIWDVIVPMGPERGRAASIGDRVALNPQPLPPRELYAAAEVARQIAYAAAAAESAGNGEGAVNLVARAIDDFCGTHPWPRPWPGPLGGADPEPDRVAEMRLVAALSMASTASRMADGDAREALTIGADKLVQAAVGRQTGEREHAIA